MPEFAVCALLYSKHELTPDRQLCSIAQWREASSWRVGSARLAAGLLRRECLWRERKPKTGKKNERSNRAGLGTANGSPQVQPGILEEQEAAAGCTWCPRRGLRVALRFDCGQETRHRFCAGRHHITVSHADFARRASIAAPIQRKTTIRRRRGGGSIACLLRVLAGGGGVVGGLRCARRSRYRRC